jgi:putative hydrolase of the HAD superfamily
MNKPKAIILDLDDTIISFSAGSRPAWEKACSDFTLNNKDISEEILLTAIFNKAKWYWSDRIRHKKGRNNMEQARREIVRMAFQELGLKKTESADKLADTYSSIRRETVTLFPNALETLMYLKNMGLFLVLLTNGDSSLQRHKIQKFNLFPLFDHIFIEGELGFGKPEPEAYLNVIDTLKLNVKELWMVGDNLEWDIEGAKKFGIFTIWNDYRRKGLPENSRIKPDMIIHNISELMAMVPGPCFGTKN